MLKRTLAALLLAGLTAASVHAAPIGSGPAGLYIRVGDPISRHGDVDTTGAVGGSCFIFDEMSQKWKAESCPGSSGGSSSLKVSVGGVQVSSPTAVLNFSSNTFSGSQSPTGTANITLTGSSVTLQGNTFNAANLLLKLDSSAYVPNAQINPSSVTKLGTTIELGSETTGNYVTSLLAGLGITVTSAGVGATPTVAFDPTLLTGNRTFADGTTASITWAFGIIGTDPSFTFSNNTITTPNDLVVGGTVTIGGKLPCLADGTNCAPGGGLSALGVAANGVIISSPTGRIDFIAPLSATLDGSTTGHIYLDGQFIAGAYPLSVTTGTVTGFSARTSTSTRDLVFDQTVFSASATVGSGSTVYVTLSKDYLTKSSATATYLQHITLADVPNHALRHQDGEVDEISVAGLSGLLGDTQRIVVSTGGTVVKISTGINIIAGANITLTGAANGGGADITIAGAAGGSGTSVYPATSSILAAQGIVSSKQVNMSSFPIVNISSFVVSGSSIEINNIKMAFNTPTGSGDRLLMINGGAVTWPVVITDGMETSSTDTVTAQKTLLNTLIATSTSIRASRIEWPDGTVQVSSPGAGGGGSGTNPGGQPGQFQYNISASSMGGVNVATFSTTGVITLSSQVVMVNVSTWSADAQVFNQFLGTMTLSSGRKVAQTAPSDTNVLCWDAANSYWKPCTAGAGGSGASVYPATAAANFPYGFTASTAANTTPVNINGNITGSDTHGILNLYNIGNAGSSSSGGGINNWMRNSAASNVIFSKIYDSGTTFTAGNEKGWLNLHVISDGAFPTYPQLRVRGDFIEVNVPIRPSLGTSITLFDGSGGGSIVFDGSAGDGTLTFDGTDKLRFDKKLEASTVSISGLGVGIAHIVATSSNVVVGQVSLSTEVTGSLPAASIANGSLGATVMASSVAAAGFYSESHIRSNLGLAIGTDVQGWDLDLDDLADGSLTGSKIGSGVPAANIANGSLGASVVTSSMAAAGFYNEAAVRSALGLAIGTNVQPYDLDLDDLADGSLTGSKIGSGVPAANIATGSLGASVMASSVAATSFQAALSAGTNITLANTGNGVSITSSKAPREYFWDAPSMMKLESNFPSLEKISSTTATNNINAYVQRFDDTTRESINLKWQMPNDTASSGNVTFRAVVKSTYSTTSNIGLDLRYACSGDNTVWNVNIATTSSGAFALNTGTDVVKAVSWTSSIAGMTGWTANSLCKGELSRDPTISGDMTGDMDLFDFIIEVPRL